MGLILPDRLAFVLITSFPTSPWQANCSLIATKSGAECVIVDPGLEAADPIDQVLAEHSLTPVAMIGTHGHIDHIGDAHRVADRHGIPLYLHPGDRELLRHPARGLGEAFAPQLIAMLGSAELPEPARVIDLVDGEPCTLADITFTPLHAPGHRPGCVVVTFDHPDGPAAFTGDVVFAGSIGRTDLPGGSMEQMQATLRDVVRPLDPATTLLPGHGPLTTLADELQTNPYLR